MPTKQKRKRQEVKVFLNKYVKRYFSNQNLLTASLQGNMEGNKQSNNHVVRHDKYLMKFQDKGENIFSLCW